MRRLYCGLAALFLFAACGDELGGLDRDALMDPTSEKMNQEAPSSYKVRVVTNIGSFVLEIDRAWATRGADRFYNLVMNGFYDEARFFRVLPNFMAQIGMHADPEIGKKWVVHPQINPLSKEVAIKDDPVQQSNKRGTVTFATSGPDSRSTQIFINFVDNGHLDGMGFAPIGKVIEGMAVVDSIYSGHGQVPDQSKILMEGNKYLEEYYPELTFIEKARVLSQ
jgi:peptidyl-prolyl cis-trans isomerase A (cyclophilin A)